MKKILTAINNPIVYEKIKKEEVELINEDIQYAEGILEILEKRAEVDFILISEKIPREINFIDLLNRIKIVNKKIKIIVILEISNFELENKLKEIPVYKIYINDKITIEELIKSIKEKELSPQEELKREINELRKLIEDTNNKNKYLEKINNRKIQSFRNKIFSNSINKIEKFKNRKNKVALLPKIIAFYGERKTGKTMFSINLFNYLKKQNKKVCLIDINENNNLQLIFKMKDKIKENKNFKIIIIDKNVTKDLSDFIKNLNVVYEYILIDLGTENKEDLNKIYNIVDKLFFLIESNLIDLKFLIININLILNKSKEKINIISNKKNKYSIDKEIIENSLNTKFKIKELEYNNKYQKYVMENNNKWDKKIIELIL